MPSTLRTTISGRDANNYVLQNLDDILDTSFGRTHTYDLNASMSLVIPWPETGETFVYLRCPRLAHSYNLNIGGIVSTSQAHAGWDISAWNKGYWLSFDAQNPGINFSVPNALQPTLQSYPPRLSILKVGEMSPVLLPEPRSGKLILTASVNVSISAFFV